MQKVRVPLEDDIIARDCLEQGGQMGALMRSMDWSKTPIGAVESWSPTLRMVVKLLLVNRFQLFLWWGPQFCQIYNDASRPILGKKHPKSMGQPAHECWAEIWHIIGPLIETPYGGGDPTWMDDIFLDINRFGFTEETHFTIAYSPVPDPTVPGRIGGVLGTVHEITEKIIAERRVRVLRDLGARSSGAKSAQEACAISAEILAHHAKDIPFALLYLVDADRKRAHLAGTAGVEGGRDESPLIVELDQGSNTSPVWPLAEVFNREATQVLEGLSARLPHVPAGPWSDPPHSAVVMPIPSNIAHQFAGLLVLGISSRLCFDVNYRTFCELVTSQVATAIANARAYEEERKRAEALAAIDRAKTAFFSNVSHEFRTPLTLMLAPLEDVLAGSHGELAKSPREQLTVVHRNSLRLLKLVNSLLDFSRIEAGRIQASYQPTDIATFTADLASSFRSAMQRAGLNYTVVCPPLDEEVFLDRDMWEKIVLNLISNAFKFTFQGTVSVVVESAGNSVRLHVSDTGTGIPESELPQVFERFHRVAGAKGRTYEGTGIGLALVQELVKLHHGSVTVQSKEGQGTTFTITIPKGKDHLPADRVGAARTLSSSAIRADSFVEEALRWLPGESADLADNPEVKSDPMASTLSALADTVGSQSAPQLIVVADDNADMRDYVRRLLSVQYRVHAVSNGQDAVKAAREFHADLILTDVMMPGLDGFGVLRALRSDPFTRVKPVILVSARAGEESRVEGLEAGADDYLVKPFTARELLARVGAHLEMARVRTEAADREHALRAEVEMERNRLHDSFSQAPAPIALLSGPEHKFVFVNEAYVRLVARDREHLVGKTFREAFPEVQGQGYYELLDTAYQTGVTCLASEREVKLDRAHSRDTLYLDFTYLPMRGSAGEVQGILFQCVDVTAKVLARARLEESVNERTAELELANDRLRALHLNLMQAQEEERRRLGRELHDSVGQLLVALKWKLHPLQQEAGRGRAQVSDIAKASINLLDELAQELRTISHLLHPPLLEEAGLAVALRAYVQGLQERSGLAVKLEIDPHLQKMPAEIETTVFRMVQEGLTNIHRHAKAKTATVRISGDSGSVKIQVQDEGKGIPSFTSLEDPNVKLGVGIQGMRERIRQLKGQFGIESGSSGTTVTAILPVNLSSRGPALTERKYA